MKRQRNNNTTTQICTHVHKASLSGKVDKGSLIYSFETTRKVDYNQKDTTNGAKRVRVEAYKDMALNTVVRLIETNEFKEKRRIERQQRREFFKAKRMK
jgi:hypothetical protein